MMENGKFIPIDAVFEAQCLGHKCLWFRCSCKELGYDKCLLFFCPGGKIPGPISSSGDHPDQMYMFDVISKKKGGDKE